MKKLILLSIILIVGCSTEPEDCAGVSDRDDNCYQTIEIGNQIWFEENLKTTHYKNGDEIPTGYSNSEWSNLDTGAYSIYNDETEHVQIYGNLYNWLAIDDVRGICPNEWHVPTESEWITLIEYLGGSNIAGGEMKETGTEHWTYFNEGSTNSSGFTALPGGYRDIIGSFIQRTSEASFWSSTDTTYTDFYGTNRKSAKFFKLYYYENKIDPLFGLQSAGLSVRCIKD